LRDLIELLVKGLVSHPDEVEVREIDNSDGVTLEIYVAPGEAGQVIGRGGRLISSLRTLAKAASVREGRRVYLELMD
jgi:predicted RNA-binding protein YlqC (UPF0109 family)